MNLGNVYLLVCCTFFFLNSGDISLRQDELQRIEAFRPGCCGYTSDECYATQVALLPDEVNLTCPVQTCLASSIVVLQQQGCTVENCCMATAILTYPLFLLSFGAVGCNTVSCYTLSSTADKIWSYICWSSCLPALISCGMLESHKKDAQNSGKSCAYRMDKKLLTCAYTRLRGAHAAEMRSLLSGPVPMPMNA
jgi:hypothetical protein